MSVFIGPVQLFLSNIWGALHIKVCSLFFSNFTILPVFMIKYIVQYFVIPIFLFCHPDHSPFVIPTEVKAHEMLDA